MEKIACAIAGHRPTRFKFKYNENYSLCKKIKKAMLETFRELYDKDHVREYYVGGTLGVDIWAGELLLRLKEIPGYEDIKLHLVQPFPGYDAKWDERSQKRLEFLRRHSESCVVIGQQDCRESYLRRNCYMVEHAKYLVAIYDNEKTGGADSLQIVAYARKKKRNLILIHPDTAKTTKE